MAKSKKKGKSILLLVGLLIILILAYVLILQKKEDDKKEDKVTLASVSADKVTEISYQIGDETVSLVKPEDTWLNKADINAPIKQPVVEAMLSSIADLKAETTVTSDATQLKEFGLDNPSMQITITSNDDSKFEFMIGNKLATETGYYAKRKDQDTVYTVPISFYAAYNFTNQELLVVQEFPPIDPTKITALDVVKDGKNVFKADFDEDAAQAGSYFTWKVSKPYKNIIMGDINKLNSYFINFGSLWVDECIEYNAKDLSQYGLDNPKSTIDIDYYKESADSNATDTESKKETTTSTEDVNTNAERQDCTLTIKIGSETDDNTCYVQLVGTERTHENAVYTMPINLLKQILDVKAVDYSMAYIQMITLKNLDTLSITIKDKVYKIEVKGDSDNPEYYFNGKKAQESNFKSLYETMIGVCASGEIEETVNDNTPVYEFNFIKKDKSEYNVKYLPYDGIHYYRVNINGVEEFVIDKSSFDKVMKIVSEYKGE